MCSVLLPRVLPLLQFVGTFLHWFAAPSTLEVWITANCFLLLDHALDLQFNSAIWPVYWNPSCTFSLRI
jgi:hypothetical protein